ncbi:hypothetical protein [Candidatus Nitrososphaera sp. FF02]|jgi:hypothetical protein
MSPKKDDPEIAKLISFGVDAEFARTLPKKARRQILEGITGLKKA